MDRIKVSLINDPDLTAALLAVGKPYEKDGSIELLHKVSKVLKHESVLEHIWFSWEIDGSSRLELQEHMRHRIASPTVKSTRYTLKKMLDKFMVLNNKYMVSGIDWPELHEFINEYCCLPEELRNKNAVAESLYHAFYAASEARDEYGNDVAKYFLPECLRTSFVWSLNLRSMLNFLELRTSKGAHFEIRHIANEMKKILEEGELKCFLR